MMKFKNRRHLAAFVLGVTAIPVSFGVGNRVASSYYDVATERLRVSGETAVRSGAVYLQSNPLLAERVAVKAAHESGVANNEIARTSVSDDGLGLTIRFEEKVPWQISMFALNRPRSIAVEATARITVHKSRSI